MTGRASLALGGTADHVAIARTFVAGLLRLDGFDDRCVTSARLAVSELVSAALRAGADDVSIDVTTDGAVRLVAVDSGIARPDLDELARRVVEDAGVLSVDDSGWQLAMERPT